MLTVNEIGALINVLNDADIDVMLRGQLRDKLQAVQQAMIKIERVTKLAKPEGTLIENISREEATQYSQKGEQLMLAAAKSSVPEHEHAKLVSIMIGLTSAICRLTKLPRLIFCTDLMSNVLFTALKAAYNEGLCGRGGVDNGCS